MKAGTTWGVKMGKTSLCFVKPWEMYRAPLSVLERTGTNTAALYVILALYYVFMQRSSKYGWVRKAWFTRKSINTPSGSHMGVIFIRTRRDERTWFQWCCSMLYRSSRFSEMARHMSDWMMVHWACTTWLPPSQGHRTSHVRMRFAVSYYRLYVLKSTMQAFETAFQSLFCCSTILWACYSIFHVP